MYEAAETSVWKGCIGVEMCMKQGEQRSGAGVLYRDVYYAEETFFKIGVNIGPAESEPGTCGLGIKSILSLHGSLVNW